MYAHSDEVIRDLATAAIEHESESEPGMAAGDLEVMLAAAWNLMGSEQKDEGVRDVLDNPEYDSIRESVYGESQ